MDFTNMDSDHKLGYRLVVHLLNYCWLLDPYHTYLSLASLALYPPGDDAHESWRLPRLDPLINATVETAKWAREHISIATTATSR